jgi:hypothetical protein
LARSWRHTPGRRKVGQHDRQPAGLVEGCLPPCTVLAGDALRREPLEQTFTLGELRERKAQVPRAGATSRLVRCRGEAHRASDQIYAWSA